MWHACPAMPCPWSQQITLVAKKRWRVRLHLVQTSRPCTVRSPHRTRQYIARLDRDGARQVRWQLNQTSSSLRFTPCHTATARHKYSVRHGMFLHAPWKFFPDVPRSTKSELGTDLKAVGRSLTHALGVRHPPPPPTRRHRTSPEPSPEPPIRCCV